LNTIVIPIGVRRFLHLTNYHKKQSMKKIYLLLFMAFLFLAKTTVAQIIISGSTGTANGTYTSLTNAAGAFAALNTAGSHNAGDVITISITADVTTEAGTNGLNGGTWTSITVTPSGVRSITGIVAAAPLINFNGADNVIIDGLNAGGNSLTISNTSASGSAGTSTIRFIADATGNTITNCTLRGAAATSLATDGGIILFSTGITTGNDNNTISNCDICGIAVNLLTNAIHALGSTGSAVIRNSNILINNNNIYDVFNATTSVAGINVLSGNDTWTISNNRLYQTVPRTFTGSALRYSGIILNSTTGTAGVFNVNNNVIGFGSALGTGTTAFSGLDNEFRGIEAKSINTASPSQVYSNTISGINITSSRNSTSTLSASFIGIIGGETGGFFNIGGSGGNNIGSLDGSSTIVINATSTTASTSPIICIYDFSLNSNTISNNNIGSITINSGGTGTTVGFRGIFVNTAATASATVNNNTIGGTAAGSITDNIVGAYSMYGIQFSLTAVNATGNIIRNITGNSNTASGVVGGGILVSSTTAGGISTISQNTIHSLLNNSGAANSVIYVMSLALSPGANIVERNFIHSISITSSVTTGQIFGIYESAGSGTFKNNMVRLGTDANGNSITLGLTIYGIYQASTSSNNNFYHNSVYIGGSGVISSSNTYAFVSTTVTSTRDIRNNIFWNGRSNASGGVANIAIRVGGTAANPAGLTTNYNDLYATGVDGYIGVFNGIIRNALTDWKTATGQDATSFSGNPHFINRNGNAASVDLHIASPTPIEAVGTNIASVTNDYDGQTRLGLTPTDIGADADNLTYGVWDEDAPVISYTVLPNTPCAAINPVLNATITDVLSGVNSTTGTKPRIYFKKLTNANSLGITNDNTTDGWKYAEATNASSPFTLPVDFSLIFGGVSAGDNIQYFVVAQDLASIPNVGINSGTFAAAPASVALGSGQFPLTGTINSFNITSGGILTTVTIGAAGTYTSLTGAGGLFAAINANGLAGNTTATIIDPTIAETGVNSLTPIGYACAATYTLTIKPATGVTTTLSGANATALINLNGATYVTIDGSNNGSGSKDMTISNTNTTGPTILLSNGASNNIIKNTVIKGATISYGVVTFGSTTLGGAANSDNVVQNNDITKAATQPIIGVYNIGLAGKPNSNNVIANNRITDFSVAGYIDGNGGLAGYSNNTQVAYNEIYQTTTTSTGALEGIQVNNAAGVTGTFIYKNYIHDLTTSSTATISGIDLFNAVSVNVNNNMISLINNTGSLRGIALQLNLGGTANVYYNTVSIAGTTSSTYASFAFLKNSTGIGDNIRNNIFSNKRVSSGTANQYAMATTTVGTYTSNYNDLYSSGNARNILGLAVAVDQPTLGTWQTASTGDGNSQNVQPVFISTTNLHLAPDANCTLDGGATPIGGYTLDYDDNARDASTPDIGADEFTRYTAANNAALVTASVTGLVPVTCDEAGWTYYKNPADASKYLFAIQWDPTSLGLNASAKSLATVNLTVDPGVFSVNDNSVPFGTWTMNRYWNVNLNGGVMTDPVNIRFFYDATEKAATDAAAAAFLLTYPSGSPEPPSWFKTKTTNFAGDAAHMNADRVYDAIGLVDLNAGGAKINNVLYAEFNTISSLNGGSYATGVGPNTPLPIILNYLRGVKQGSKNNLSWQVTCTSTPKATLTLERSSDATSFTAIYTIVADAVRCYQPFDYQDANPAGGRNFYRLKMTDEMGKFTYSNIIVLLNDTKGFEVLNIAPNPVTTGRFKLNVTSAENTKMNVVIIDMQGRVVQQQTMSMIAGYNSLDMNVINLAAGTYTIYGTTASDRSKVIRFVKQ
jgi:hypothetical protein